MRFREKVSAELLFAGNYNDIVGMCKVKQPPPLLLDHIGIKAIRPQKPDPMLQEIALAHEIIERDPRLGDPQVELPPGQRPVITLNGVINEIRDQ